MEINGNQWWESAAWAEPQNIINTIPEINEQYIWTPQISNNYVPGLEPLLTYINSKYPTLSALQNEITNVNNTITNEITREWAAVDPCVLRGIPKHLTIPKHFLCIPKHFPGMPKHALGIP